MNPCFHSLKMTNTEKYFYRTTLRTTFGEHRRAVFANDANQPRLIARHFNSGSHCISDMKIRAFCPISGINAMVAKDRKCVSFPNFEPYTALVLRSVFPSFSVICLCLTCSDIGRFNPAFVYIVLLLALCMPSHITPIINPVHKI